MFQVISAAQGGLEKWNTHVGPIQLEWNTYTYTDTVHTHTRTSEALCPGISEAVSATALL